jgi:hypothetical protein
VFLLAVGLLGGALGFFSGDADGHIGAGPAGTAAPMNRPKTT